MTLVEKQQRLLEELALIPDRHEQIAALVARARRAAPLSVQEKTDLNRVPGCISPVWLVASLQDGRLHLRADAESPLVKGLVAFLCELYDGATPAEIIADSSNILELTGLTRDLSPTRRHGLSSVLARIRQLAASPR